MSESSGKTVKVKFEIEIEGVEAELHDRLMAVHEVGDLTDMVKRILNEADAGSYTKVIWGQWQQLG